MEKSNLPRHFTIVEHLEELRLRLIICIVFIVLASFISFPFVKQILEFLSKPVGKLVFIAPTELFLAYIKVSLLCGVFISSPVVIYHVWRYISKALFPTEKKGIILFSISSFVLFLTGAIFAFFIIIPIGLEFLLSFSTPIIQPMISVAKYVSFLQSMLLIFGLSFQMPLLSLFLTKAGIINAKFLWNRQKYAILFIFIAAAMFTPPDVVTQLLLALPLFLLYQISVLVCKIAKRRPR